MTDTKCPKLATLREEIWPNGTDVQEQLFGNLEQLHPMAIFITEAGLTSRRRTGINININRLFLAILHWYLHTFFCKAGLQLEMTSPQ
jgi:hypothetical protein